MEKEIRKFLNSNKLKFLETDNDIQLDCFMCSDTRNRLGISRKTGAWHCFSCNKSGKKLKSLLYGIKNKDIISKDSESVPEKKSTIKPNAHLVFHKKLFKKKYKTLSYLTDVRSISKKTAKHFKLGARSIFKAKDGKKYSKGEHLAIPYIVDGKCVNFKYRNLDPDCEKGTKWCREAGGISALYNQDILNNLDYKSLIITESEIDTLSLYELGFKNTVGLTVGAKGFKQDWYDKLLRFEKIYLVLDNDKVGQEGAEMLAKRLGLGRCFNVLLPEDVKDPNDFIKKYDKSTFRKLLNKGTKFQVRGSRSLRAMMEKSIQKRFYESENDMKGSYDTPWKKVNEVLGPVRDGHLFVLCGKPKCFHEDSLVTNPTTGSTLTIKEAVENKLEKILSYNVSTCKLEVRKINSWMRSGYEECVEIVMDDGNILKVTLDHMVGTEHGFIPASDIIVGTGIMAKSRDGHGIILNNVASVRNIGCHECYDLEVENNHNLIVNNALCSNSGKSTLCIKLMDYWTQQGINCGMYSCEMNEISIADKFTMMKNRAAHSIDEITETETHAAMAKIAIDRMFFYYPERSELKGDNESIEKACTVIEEMVQRYGIRVFVFDNLHFLCRGENDKALLDIATQQFKLLAEQLGILIIIVAHPRKTNTNKQLTTADMKGSSSIYQDADVVWLMFRKELDGDVTPDEVDGHTHGSMSARADISITGRWTEGGNVFLAFDGKHSDFRDKGAVYKKLVMELKDSGKRKRGI